MKIGVSSQNFRTITGHTGRGRRFFIFDIDADGAPQEIDRLDMPKEMAMHNFHGLEPHPLDQLDVLITGECGDNFVHKMERRGVRVIRTSETDPMSAIRKLLAGEELPPAAPHDHGHDHDHDHDHRHH